MGFPPPIYSIFGGLQRAGTLGHSYTSTGFSQISLSSQIFDFGGGDRGMCANPIDFSCMSFRFRDCCSEVTTSSFALIFQGVCEAHSVIQVSC